MAFDLQIEPFAFEMDEVATLADLEGETLEDEVRRIRSRGPMRKPSARRPGPRPAPRRLQPKPQPRRKPPRRPSPIHIGTFGGSYGDMGLATASERVRWVQSALNDVLGLRLPVDGVMTRETRSAIRSFQKRQGLPEDGIAGPDTERALIEVRRSRNIATDASTDASLNATTDPAPDATNDTASDPNDEMLWLEYLELDDGEVLGEVNRSSSEYARWVQQSLNRILRLNLAVDGVIGSMTRSAIRSFQQQRGLTADGIVGSQTEAALIAAGASAPPGSTGSPASSSSVNTPLPASGNGFYSYTTPEKRYGTAATIRAVQAIANAWHQAHPTGPRLGIGNISRQGGGVFPPHSTHREGLNVDIRPVRHDRAESPVRYTDSAYSRSLTQELVNLIRANPVLSVSSILFNDAGVQGVKSYQGHDDHLHVTFGG